MSLVAAVRLAGEEDASSGHRLCSLDPWIAILALTQLCQCRSASATGSSSALRFVFHGFSGGGRCKEAAAAEMHGWAAYGAPSQLNCACKLLARSTCKCATLVPRSRYLGAGTLVQPRHVTPGICACAAMRRLRPTHRTGSTTIAIITNRQTAKAAGFPRSPLVTGA